MKKLTRNSKPICRPRQQWVASRLYTLFLLPLAILMLLAPGAQAARPGGVAVLLPPFVATPSPQPFLWPVSPFDVFGFIQSATLDATCTAHPFCGGTMEVNGLKIIVPTNTIFQMPATAMTWEDMFTNAPLAYKLLGQTGLALSDGIAPTALNPNPVPPKPFTTYEVHVQGNRVINTTAGTDQYIAGLIYISNQSVNTGQGVINCIDYAKHEMWVGQPLQVGPPCTGARIRLNTPSGRYGTPDPLADPRFTSDEDNPTIVSATGYPMCLPRTDPKVANDSLCPSWNRPRDPFTGAFSTNFILAPATAGAPDATGIVHQLGYPNPPVQPDPFEQMPFEVGDYISYVGTVVNDVPCVAGLPASSCQYISAHTITDELGIYTAPGTWPVYTFMGEFRIGAGGTPNPFFPQEAVEKVFGDFFTTDNTQLVDVYAVDVNPCTGVKTHRFYGSSDPFGPPLGGVKGRARFRVTVGNFLPATREMAVASRSYTKGLPLDSVPVTLIANGLAAGQFQAPQFEFIFPENLVLGSPQIPLTFQEFPFLVNGSGPYVPFGSPVGTAPVGAGATHQLTPFPSLNSPASSCTTVPPLIQPPISNAGSPQTVASGATVTLDASGSIDPNVPALQLIYTWQQSAGPAVQLLNANSANPTFTAPILAAGAAPVVLTFQFVACNGFTCGAIASVNITVSSSAGAGVTLSATPATNVPVGTAVTLTATTTAGAVTFKQTAGPAQVFTSTTASTATFTATLPLGTVTPATLTFTATAGTTTATINVMVGPDAIFALNVTYALSKSRLQVSATDSIPGGVAQLKVTPLDANGLPLTAAVFMTYDPTLNAYIAPLNWIVNPIPNTVKIESNFGGVLITPITKIR